MKYVVQSLYIMAFWALGLGVSFLTGGVIPGSVLGMLFLFMALALGFIKEEKVDTVAGIILKYMMLFFLPAVIGIMVAWDMISANLWAIVVSATVSLVLVVAVVGLVQQKLGRKW